MKQNMLKLGTYAFAAAAILAGCKGGSSSSFTTDATTNVQYRILKQGNGGTKAEMGGVARVMMIGKTEKDSVIYNSVKQGGDSMGTFRIPLKKSFNGCLEQGIAMLSVGDSAEFKVNADSLYLSTFRMRKLPSFIRPGSMITFDIKLVSFQTEKEATDERNKMMEKRMAEMQERKAAEPAAIAKYLADNKLNVKPTEDSLFFLMREGKGGKPVKEGDSIYVKYTLMMLDNTVLETSDHGPGHNSFPLVYSKNMGLIKGWVEALGTMHDGEKVRILVPSALGYGAQGSRTIMPYTPLVFDMEITRLVPAKK